MGIYLRSGLILAILWLIPFSFTFALLYAYVVFVDTGQGITLGFIAVAAISVALIFIFLNFLIGPFIMDFVLRFFYDMDWVPITELPAYVQNQLNQSMETYNYKLGKFGILRDGSPNAFTYGHFRNGARIVVSEGIFDLLTEDETSAVIEHELGHIVHRDFIFMTLAQAIPLLFLLLYVVSRGISSSTSRSSSDNNAAGAIAGAAFLIAILSYIMYIVTRFIVLFLSRLRELYADYHSVHTTGNPHAMASALVKIGYGLVLADEETRKKIEDDNTSDKEKRKLQNQSRFSWGVRTMGISDLNTARGMTAITQKQDVTEVDDETVAAAAAWDFSAPWAKLVELSSTHPLTGKRLKAIDDQAEQMGIPRKYPLLKTYRLPESLWDEFFADVFVQYLILPMAAILIAAGTIASLILGGFLIGTGVGIFLFSLMWFWRIRIKYPKIRYSKSDAALDLSSVPHGSTVLEAMADLTPDSYYEASPVRGKPIVLDGFVLGRGDAGARFGDDLVIRDKTGIMTIDYSSVIPFYRFWFAWRHVPKILGQKIRVVGWYHRSIRPRIQLKELYREDGKVNKNRWRGVNLIFAYLLALAGLALIGVSIYIIFTAV